MNNLAAKMVKSELVHTYVSKLLSDVMPVTHNYVSYNNQFFPATLKNIEGNAVLMRQRGDQLEKRKQEYKWQFFPTSGLPSGLNDGLFNIPIDEEFERVKLIDFTKSGLKGIIATDLAGVLHTVTNLNSYIHLADHLDKQELNKVHETGRWLSDVEFGRQMLNGVNPVVIKKCTALPENFPVTNDMVQTFLTRGITLDQEIEVFILLASKPGSFPRGRGKREKRAWFRGYHTTYKGLETGQWTLCKIYSKLFTSSGL